MNHVSHCSCQIDIVVADVNIIKRNTFIISVSAAVVVIVVVVREGWKREIVLSTHQRIFKSHKYTRKSLTQTDR